MKPAAWLLGLMIVAPIGCLPNFDHILGPVPSPHFTIISKTVGTQASGNADVIIQVRNEGDAAGYNVTCLVRAWSQSWQTPAIVDSNTVTFANGRSIPAGGDATGEAIFFKLKTLDGISLTYDLDWLPHNAGFTGQI